MNQGFEYREQVGASGATVLSHLVERYRHSSVDVWRARVDAGEVLVDGVVACRDQPLRAGQLLVWRRPPWEEPRVPLTFAVLHRDEHLLAVAKPSGLPAVPNGGFLTHTLLHVVRRHFSDAVPLHRLGRGTSGVVLFARSALARRAGAAAWREGRVVKIYRALVSGVPIEPSFSVTTSIGPVPHPLLGTIHAAVDEGRAARTDVRLLQVRDGHALVEATLHSGRPHQIRIHLAAAGHPLVGDPLYAVGGLPRVDAALPGAGGYLLHSQRLELAHPLSGEWCVFECGAPPSLRLERESHP